MNSDFATIGETLDAFEDCLDPDAPLAEVAEARYALRRIEEQNERLAREVSEHAAAVQHASDLQDEAEAERDRLKEQLQTLQRERDEAIEDALRLGAFSGKDEAVAEVERLKEQLEAMQRRADRRTGIADRLHAENQRLREVLARVRPDIDPDTGYGRQEQV